MISVTCCLQKEDANSQQPIFVLRLYIFCETYITLKKNVMETAAYPKKGH